MKFITDRKILIADDNAENLKVLRSLLAEHNHALRFAQNGQEAINILEKELVDLILLDVNMPIMNGFEACEQIKSNERTAHIPILLITGMADRKSVVEGFKKGATDYITKPFSIEELQMRVNTQLTMIENQEERIKAKQKEILIKENIKRVESNLYFFSVFVNGLADQLKNPLNIIINLSSIIKSKISENSEVLEQFEQSIEQSWKMHKIVNNLEQMYLKPSEEKLEFTAKELIDECYNSLETSEVDFKLEIKDNIPSLKLNKASIKKAFQNILTNSLEAIKQAKNSGVIKINVNTNENKILFTIIDNGIGLEDQEHQDVFQAFYSPNKDVDHIGLGLTVAYSIIVIQNDGKLNIESLGTGGTIVTIELPINNTP